MHWKNKPNLVQFKCNKMFYYNGYYNTNNATLILIAIVDDIKYDSCTKTYLNYQINTNK